MSAFQEVFLDVVTFACSLVVYGCLVYALSIGVLFKLNETRHFLHEKWSYKKLAPIGKMATAIGLIGFLTHAKLISVVTGVTDVSFNTFVYAIQDGLDLLIWAMVCLAVTHLFDYLNS